MKINKLFALIMTVCMLISLAACGTSAPAPAVTAAPAAEESAAESFEAADADMLDGVSSVEQGSAGSLRVTASARGMESDVVLAVTLDIEGNATAVELVSHGETPTLGGAALEGDYLQSYVGADADAVDAYAGATYTSEAIKTCVKLAVMQYKSVNGIEFEAPKTVEELVSETLEGFVAVEGDFAAPVIGVYANENGFAVDVEGIGHEADHPMRLIVMLDKDGVVENIVVIDHQETPDLGANCLEQKYLCFYYGGKHFTMIDMGDDTKIDILSGATETSFGILKLVNAACETVAELIG